MVLISYVVYLSIFFIPSSNRVYSKFETCENKLELLLNEWRASCYQLSGWRVKWQKREFAKKAHIKRLVLILNDYSLLIYGFS